MAGKESKPPRQARERVLAIENYSLDYKGPTAQLNALRSINLEIGERQTVGLVGESGSGKTSLALAVMRYLPANAIENDGKILLVGEDLRTKSASEMLGIRGRRISMVFQDPGTSLNPSMRLGDQIAEVLTKHRAMPRREALAEGEAWLDRTGIARPGDMMRRYPHEASGGEKQRVVVATAFACNPELIVFDEPTTALDIITARQILELFARLHEETGVAALYISHDLALVSQIAQSVVVINRGEMVETGTCRRVFGSPREPYTKALMAAVPNPQLHIGTAPPDSESAPAHGVDGLSVRYGETSLLKQLLRPREEHVVGAREVSFGIRPGEFLGIVGESGSGKSTIAKAMAGLQDFDGAVSHGEAELRRRKDIDQNYRRKVQIVFQHPDASLNPRQRIREIVARPLKLYGAAPRPEIPGRVGELLEKVLLPAEFAERFPHQLSGGEKQRVAIARAFAAEPDLVICDEITSSLDVSVQSAIARLLIDLQRETGISCMFITHDLNLVRQLAHRIVVMHRGRLVDMFMTEDAESGQRHEYTKALLNAVPNPAQLWNAMEA